MVDFKFVDQSKCIADDGFLLGISGGVSFLTYLPTTPSFIVLSLLFRDNISQWLDSNTTCTTIDFD